MTAYCQSIWSSVRFWTIAGVILCKVDSEAVHFVWVMAVSTVLIEIFMPSSF